MSRQCIQRSLSWLIVLIYTLSQIGCTLSHPTKGAQLYHSITARYNTLHNARESFREARRQSLADDENEDFFSLLSSEKLSLEHPLLLSTIEKCQKAIQNHSLRTAHPKHSLARIATDSLGHGREHNPAMRLAWSLLGRAHYYSGHFAQALEVFDYTAKLYEQDEEIRQQAELWHVRCLIQSGEIAQAQKKLQSLNNKPTIPTLLPLLTRTELELQLSLGNYDSAIPSLQRLIPRVKSRQEQARLSYLLGQVTQLSGDSSLARTAFGEALHLSTSPSLELSCRLRLIELSETTSSTGKELLQLLERGRYQGGRDQILYTLGMNSLRLGQTPEAKRYFSLAIDTSRRQGEAFLRSLLMRSSIELQEHSWQQASRSLHQALERMPERDVRRDSLSKLCTELDALPPLLKQIHDSDSLLRLSRLPEGKRAKILAEQRRTRAHSPQNILASALPEADSPLREQTSPAPRLGHTDASSYFYSAPLLAQGRQLFHRIWGKRPLQDHWRTLSQSRTLSSMPEYSSTPRGSMTPDTLTPHSYTFPLTREEEQRLESLIETALYQLGLQLLQRLHHPEGARSYWQRLLDRFPQGHYTEEVRQRLAQLPSSPEKPAP